MKSSKKLFFSIILPSFNRSDVINQTIQSVIYQTYENWELIIVDDGSTDNTKKIVDEIKNTESRIKYIYQQNEERSSARNNGINNAKGDFICFIDSDDLFDENHLKIINETIRKSNDENAIYITGQSVLENGIIKKLPFEKIESPSTEFFFSNTIITGRIAISSKILNEFKFNTRFTISEDTDLFVRIACSYPKIIQIEEHTLIYRVHDHNSVNPKKYNAYLKRKVTLSEIYKNNKKYLNKKIVSITINNCYFGIYTYYKTNKYYFNAFYSMFEAIVKLPNHRLKEKVYLMFTAFNKNTTN